MNITLLFIITIAVLIAIFDVYIIAQKGKKESISAHIIRVSHNHPLIPFLLGIVCGHLFWSMKTAIGEKIGLGFRDNNVFWVSLKKRWTKIIPFNYPIERTPGKSTPYPSRDFWLGASYLRFTNIEIFTENDWVMSPVPLPRLKIFKLLYQLYQLRNKDRNYFWMNPGFEQVYRVAFMIPLHDRAFHYRMSRVRVPLICVLIEWIDKIIPSNNLSGKFIRFLKYGERPSRKEWIEKFQEDHPFVTCQIANS